MSIAFACPSCSARVRAPREAAGQSLACPQCSTILTVPTSTPAATVARRKVDREPDEGRELEPSGTPWWVTMLLAAQAVTWILLFLAVGVGGVLFTLSVAGANSAPQEAAAGAVFSTAFIGLYVVTRCVEKVTNVAVSRGLAG